MKYKVENIVVLKDGSTVYIMWLMKGTIPEEILNKLGSLTDDEYEMIKQHVQYDYEILKKSDCLPNLALGAGYHHKRIDGKGYPNGKQTKGIPQIA